MDSNSDGGSSVEQEPVGDDQARGTTLRLFEAAMAWQRAAERLYVDGEIAERADAPVDRLLHPTLFLLGEAGPLRVKQIAEGLAILHSTASRHVDRLHRQGLVERETDPDDGRAALVALTPHGRDVRDALARAWADAFSDALSDSDPESVGQMTQTLERMTKAFSTSRRKTIDSP